jgi:hypothetical protein
VGAGRSYVDDWDAETRAVGGRRAFSGSVRVRSARFLRVDITCVSAAGVRDMVWIAGGDVLGRSSVSAWD